MISRGWPGTRSIGTADSKIGAGLAEAITIQEHGKTEMQVRAKVVQMLLTHTRPDNVASVDMEPSIGLRFCISTTPFAK